MDYDFQKIYSNYITRLVIFSVFLYGGLRKNEKEYENSVKKFLNKRIKNFNITLEVGPKFSKQDSRDIIIQNLLEEGEEIFINNLVVVQFKTGTKDISLQINLDQEDKYEIYLYNWYHSGLFTLIVTSLNG